MAVHVVRDTGGDWRTALANSFLAPLLTGLVNNHFEGLRTAKENALLGELANAAGNMPNTAPEQGNGFAGQFTPPGMMQSGQGGGLNQLFSVLGNPRFKSVNAARAMELAKPWLTEQFYNGFNPADTAQMMRGMGMGYVPKEAASYYSDMYKYQNPHRQFQNMNLGDRVVYGGFNPANGQFTQGGEMAVGMNPYQAGSLANDRQRIANDYALGVRRDDTSRYGMDLQNQQFGATMDYNREGREADNAFRDRQQTWYENPENPRNRTEKELYVDAEGNVVRIDKFAEAGNTGVKANPLKTTGRGTSAYERMNEYDKMTLKNNQDKLPDLLNTLANLTVQKEVAEDPAIRAEYQNQIDAINKTIADMESENARIRQEYGLDGGAVNANTQQMSSAPQGAAQQSGNAAPQTSSARFNDTLAKFGGNRPIEGDETSQRFMRYETYAAIMRAIDNKQTPYSSPKEFLDDMRANGIKIAGSDGKIVQDNAPQGTGTADAMNAIGGKTAPNAEAKPQRTDTAAAMKAIGSNTPQTQTAKTPLTTDELAKEGTSTADAMSAISGDIAPKPQRTQTKAKPKSAPWTKEQMKYWDRMPWNAPKAYKEWKAQNGGR